MTAFKAWPYPLDLCQTREAWDTDGILYQGFSNDPTAEGADAKWVILKHFYTDGNHTGTCFADSDDSPNKVWDDRAEYTYILDT